MDCMTSKMRVIKVIAMVVVVVSTFTKCTDEGLVQDSATARVNTTLKASTLPETCSVCKYIVPENMNTIDGTKLGFKPGDVICLSAAKKYTTPLRFINMVGSATNPILITNCGGTVSVTVPNTVCHQI
jgi:hypothetical protein